MFREGKSFGQYPLRLIWVVEEARKSPFPVQMAVSVPKRRFKKAVDRNRIKRLVREAYRLHKHLLYGKLEAGETQIAWMILFTGKEMPTYREIEKAVRQIIPAVCKKMGSGTFPVNLLPGPTPNQPGRSL